MSKSAPGQSGNPRGLGTDSRPSNHEDGQAKGLGDGGADAAIDSRQIVGLKLITLLRKTAIERNLPERYIADHMGVTQIYWNAMANGNRRISGLPKDKMQRLAEFLELPLIQVYVLADHFMPEDFVVQKSLPSDLDRMIEFMRTDPTWLALAPSHQEWAEMGTRAKVLVAALYERLVHKSFLRASKVETPSSGGGTS